MNYNIYGISGLGADKRVYKKLTFNAPFYPIDWIEPLSKEPIEAYALRLAEVIDQNVPYVIIGVSFGGLIAIEMSKKLSPLTTILISSVDTKYGIPKLYRFFGSIGIITFLPQFLAKPPHWFATYTFDAKDTALLKIILRDTDTKFSKWAMQELTTWNQEDSLPNVTKICGEIDKVLPPLPAADDVIIIPKGGHFMIVDRCEEVSEVISKIIHALIINIS